jgi:hypothetical protein
MAFVTCLPLSGGPRRSTRPPVSAPPEPPSKCWANRRAGAKFSPTGEVTWLA